MSPLASASSLRASCSPSHPTRTLSRPAPPAPAERDPHPAGAPGLHLRAVRLCECVCLNAYTCVCPCVFRCMCQCVWHAHAHVPVVWCVRAHVCVHVSVLG